MRMERAQGLELRNRAISGVDGTTPGRRQISLGKLLNVNQFCVLGVIRKRLHRLIPVLLVHDTSLDIFLSHADVEDLLLNRFTQKRHRNGINRDELHVNAKDAKFLRYALMPGLRVVFVFKLLTRVTHYELQM